MQQRLGPQVEILVETVNQIPRTPAGKFHAVISLLPRGQARASQKTQ
jgi:hypothetical protein